MYSIAYLIGIQLIFIHATYSQCANRVVQGPNGPIELLPNQMLVPGASYLGSIPGQSVYVGPNQPCQPPQPVLYPGTSIPTEYNIPNIPPVLANLAPPQNILAGNTIAPNVPAIPNMLSGNVIVPNIPTAVPNVLSGNVFVPNIPSVINNAAPGNAIVPNLLSGNLFVPPFAESYAPTVVHDNSVANGLANALQLLVVSSLLSNTLPEPFEPPYYDGYMPSYGYGY